MMTMNRVTLVGYAGRNPEMRKLQSGDDVAQFSLATTERFRRRDDTVGESTEWHSVVAFGAAAEAVRKLVRKGAPVLVEGRITSRTWTDRTGAERRATEIVVSGPRGQVNVLAKRKTGTGGDDVPPGGAAGTGPAKGAEAANGSAQAAAGAAGSPSSEDAAAAGVESEGTGEIAAAGGEAVAADDDTGGDPPGGAAGHSEDAAGGASAGDAGVEAVVPANANAGTAGRSDDDDDHD